MAGKVPEYHAFLLRLWVVGHREEPIWRMTLHSPQTQEVRGFDSLQSLVEYLDSLIKQTAPKEEG